MNGCKHPKPSNSNLNLNLRVVVANTVSSVVVCLARVVDGAIKVVVAFRALRNCSAAARGERVVIVRNLRAFVVLGAVVVVVARLACGEGTLAANAVVEGREHWRDLGAHIMLCAVVVVIAWSLVEVATAQCNVSFV